MAEHRTVRLLIANFWGHHRGGAPVNGTATGIPALVGAPAYFDCPINTTGDLLPGDLVVTDVPEFTPYQTNSAANTQSAYDTSRDTISFATYDPLRGVRNSFPIEFGKIERINTQAPQVKTQHVVIFHFPYNSIGITNLNQGDELTVRVALDRSYDMIAKRDIFATARLGATPPNNTPPIPATDAQIQAAHQSILLQLLASDPEGFFLDRNASIAMSNAANYQSVVLVGALRRVLPFQNYAEFQPVILDVSLIKGINQEIVAFTGMTNAAAIAAYNNSLAVGTERPFIGTYILADQGSGYPEQVRSKEREYLGNWDHMNTVMWQTFPKTFVNDNIMYSFVGIDHMQTIRNPGENNIKNPITSTYIYLGYLTGANTWLTPQQMDWRNGNFGGFAPITFGGVQNSVITTPFPPGVGTRTIIDPINPYVPPAVPAQVGPNATFNGTTGSVAIDGTVGTFIQALSNQLVS